MPGPWSWVRPSGGRCPGMSTTRGNNHVGDGAPAGRVNVRSSAQQCSAAHVGGKFEVLFRLNAPQKALFEAAGYRETGAERHRTRTAMIDLRASRGGSVRGSRSDV